MVLDFITEQDEPQNEITPTLSEVIAESEEALRADIKVALPAKIISYDKDKQLAVVQPLVKKKYNDGSVVSMPQIFNVPVAHPRAGSAYIHMPIKKDHNVLLVFADRSLDKWLSTGGDVDPDDVRTHHVSDAIAYPGLYPFSEAEDIDNGDDIIVKNKNGDSQLEMRIKPNNHLQFINKDNELVNVLNEMLRVIRESVVYTSTGAQPLRHAEFSKIASKLKSFEEV
ncbi:MAG: hypothetical protein GWN93_27060 [Deltaproteobacteria bacterium]|nr:hypothetical protein [Deltaproteobacteria bacterium]